MAYKLDDYVEVSERVRAWHAEHPEGRIECGILTAFTSEAMWTVRAEVYRTSDPAEPPAGVGHSFLSIPGTTNFTRGSELENAETSAVGRALVFAGIPAKSVASAGEVRAKQGPPSGPPAPSSPTPEDGATSEESGPGTDDGVSRTAPAPRSSEHEHDWETSKARVGMERCRVCGEYREAAA